MIIDADGLILGRLASFAAKQALNGEDVIIVNCEKTVVSGSFDNVISKYKRLFDMGHPRYGPFWHRKPDLFVRRIIRGMLPWKKPRGREAFKKIKCYVGFPEQLKGSNPEKLEHFHASKLLTSKQVSVGRICSELGHNGGIKE